MHPEVRSIDIQLFTAMYLLYYNTDDLNIASERFNRLVTARWFTDGLDAREREFIVTLGMVSRYDDALFDRLFTNFR